MDQIYPEENLPLARAIIEDGGMLLTEMPLGWQPRAPDFPRRNRLVAGLSLGVVVVEVFAVPGSPLDPRAEGGNHLI